MQPKLDPARECGLYPKFLSDGNLPEATYPYPNLPLPSLSYRFQSPGIVTGLGAHLQQPPILSGLGVNPQDLDKACHLFQIAQGQAHGRVVTPQNVDEKQVLPRFPPHRTRLNLAQIEIE
jgi:hypothetical protein